MPHTHVLVLVLVLAGAFDQIYEVFSHFHLTSSDPLGGLGWAGLHKLAWPS